MVHQERTFYGLKPEIDIEVPNTAVLEVQVANALAQDGKIDPADVVVVDVEGHIHLSGAVSTPGEVDRATEIAKSVQGVDAVTNNIVVG